MTACLDWKRIARGGDRFLAEDSSDRRRTLRHIGSCPNCRRSALELDPTLAVANLPLTEVPAADVETVRRQVQALRRVRAIEARRRRPALAHVAVVILVTGLGFLLPGKVVDRSGPPVGAIASEMGEGVVSGALFDEGNRSSVASLALVESISPSTARIYQLDQEDFPIVMIVDESIDL